MGLEKLKSAFSNISQNLKDEKEKTITNDVSSFNFGSFMSIRDRLGSFNEVNPINISAGSMMSIEDNLSKYREINPLNISAGSLMSVSDLLGGYREINPLNISAGSLMSINDRLGSFNEVNPLNLSVGSLLPVSDMFGRIMNFKAVKGDGGKDVTNLMRTFEKSTYNVSDLTRKFEKSTEDVSDLTRKFEKSTKALGIFDEMDNDKADGFSLDQVHQSPTKFTGAGEHKTEPYMEWTNNSLYGNVLGDTYTFDNGLPAIDATTWEIPTDFTYQNSQYGVNAISDTFSETWTYEDGSGITPNNIPPHGTTWNLGEESLTSYYDKIHTDNAIEDIFQGPVDFMHGGSSYFGNVTPEIPGFTKNFGISNIVDDGETGLPMGYLTADGEAGVSRFLRDEKVGLGDRELGTGTHTIKIPSWQMGTVGTITFPGPLGNFELYQTEGDNSLIDGIEDDTLSRTWTPSTSYSDSIHPNNSSQFINPDVNSWPFGRKVTFLSGDEFNDQTELGMDKLVFETLYNNDQTVTDAKFGIKDKFSLSSGLWTVDPNRVGGTAQIGIFKTAVEGVAELIPGNPLGQALSLGNKTEPYVISEIGNDDTHWTDQFLPVSRLQKDVQRVGKFLSSQKGESFILEQNLMGTFQQYKGIYDPSSTLLNVVAPKEGLGTPMLRFSRDKGAAGIILDLLLPTTYTEYLDSRVTDIGGRLLRGEAVGTGLTLAETIDGTVNPKTYAERDLAHKPLAFKGIDLVEGGLDLLAGKMGLGGTEPRDVAGITKASKIDSKLNMQNSMATTTPLGNFGKGDIMTLHGIVPSNAGGADAGDTGDWWQQLLTAGASALGLDAGASRELELETSKEGMPFYFIDLRDNKKVYFRAYIDGISDAISPSWTSENYIGRSEPVYTYTNAEREIGFNLKLFAQTKDELNMIYKKMNRLTSMCYPEYKKPSDYKVIGVDGKETGDVAVSGVMGKERMKPPLTKFRLGELFGSKDNEMTGFIKSLSYTFPDNSPWEIKNKQRVPKYVEVDITYQVIHSTVPSLDFATMQGPNKDTLPNNTFYGINQDTSKDKDSNYQIGV